MIEGIDGKERSQVLNLSDGTVDASRPGFWAWQLENVLN
jgi:hypothetical protein